MEPVDMGHLLQSLRDMHAATSDNDDVELSMELINGKLMMVSGLEDRIIQVLRNLIGNAVSFSPPGGAIFLEAEQRGNMVTVTVEDEGPGIPAGLEEKIFNRFYQERPTEEKFGTHSGLGLSISKQIVETHGGSIWAENRISDRGDVVGARFTVQLPASS